MTTMLLTSRELALLRVAVRHRSLSHLSVDRLVEHSLFRFGMTPFVARSGEPCHEVRVGLGAAAAELLAELQRSTGLTASNLLARCLLELLEFQRQADPDPGRPSAPRSRAPNELRSAKS